MKVERERDDWQQFVGGGDKVWSIFVLPLSLFNNYRAYEYTNL